MPTGSCKRRLRDPAETAHGMMRVIKGKMPAETQMDGMNPAEVVLGQLAPHTGRSLNSVLPDYPK
jgi:hypothetical protein